VQDPYGEFMIEERPNRPYYDDRSNSHSHTHREALTHGQRGALNRPSYHHSQLLYIYGRQVRVYVAAILSSVLALVFEEETRHVKTSLFKMFLASSH